MFDDFRFESRPGFGAAGGVTDAGGVVAYDDDGEMTGFLKLPDLGQNEGMAEMEVGSGRVEAEFHAERPAGGEFLGAIS